MTKDLDREIERRCARCVCPHCAGFRNKALNELDAADARIAVLEAERDTLLGSLKTSNKAGLQILADLHAAMRALEQAHGGGQCKCCRFTFDGREGRCFANETLTRLKAAYPEVPEPTLAECTNPDCPVGCPDSHALPFGDAEVPTNAE